LADFADTFGFYKLKQEKIMPIKNIRISGGKKKGKVARCKFKYSKSGVPVGWKCTVPPDKKKPKKTRKTRSRKGRAA